MKIKVTPENYEKEVLQSKKTVLVEFYAVWCSKCAMMEDIIEEISEEYADSIKVCQIDIEESPKLTTEFEVGIVPVFAVFKGGRPQASASGLLNKKSLIRMIG